MKSLFTIFFIITTTFCYAQFPQTSPKSERVEAMASELTESYNKKLGLTSIQIPLFKDVVEKYIDASDEAKAELEGKEELDALVELQARESLEMNDILTLPQYRLYQKLKFDLQPLKVVDTE